MTSTLLQAMIAACAALGVVYLTDWLRIWRPLAAKVSHLTSADRPGEALAWVVGASLVQTLVALGVFFAVRACFVVN